MKTELKKHRDTLVSQGWEKLCDGFFRKTIWSDIRHIVARKDEQFYLTPIPGKPGVWSGTLDECLWKADRESNEGMNSSWREAYRDEVVYLTGDAVRANEMANNYVKTGRPSEVPVVTAREDVRKGVKGTPLVDRNQGELKL